MTFPQASSERHSRTRWLKVAAAFWLLLISAVALINSVGLSRLAEQTQGSAQDAQVKALGLRVADLEQQADADKRRPAPISQAEFANARQALDEPLAPYLPLFQGDPEYRFDVLEIRHALEGATAWHAALRATDEDRTRIAQAFQTMMDAHGKDDPTGEAEADAAFHLSIAEASHNLVLLQVMRGLFDLLQTNISQSREKLYTSARTFSPLSDQHREMMDAVLAGDPERARAAAHAHLEFVHTTLRTLDDNEARRARASRLPSPHG